MCTVDAAGSSFSQCGLHVGTWKLFQRVLHFLAVAAVFCCSVQLEPSMMKSSSSSPCKLVSVICIVGQLWSYTSRTLTVSETTTATTSSHIKCCPGLRMTFRVDGLHVGGWWSCTRDGSREAAKRASPWRWRRSAGRVKTSRPDSQQWSPLLSLYRAMMWSTVTSV